MEVIKFKDGNGYVSKENNNKYRRVPKLDSATIFRDGDASKFIKNSVSKVFREKMEVTNYEDSAPYLVKTNSPDNNTMTKMPNVRNGTSADVITDTPFNTLDFDWATKLKEEDQFKKDLDTYKRNLPQMLSRIDGEICDIEHYIEFNTFSACEGFKLCKLLKDKRVLRRKIKDEINIVEILYRDWVAEQKSENIFGTIEGMLNREYTPRALPELFSKV